MTRSSRPRVLLADDYAGIISALRRILAPSCDIVGHVSDGARLIEAAAALRPDVVVADVGLPKVNGLDACFEIMQSSPTPKIILISAADDPHVRKRALELGAVAFIQKGRIPDELEAAIGKAFVDA